MPHDISTWIADLSDPAVQRRLAAAEALSRAGEAARGAAVALVRACGDDDESVREASVAALEELGPPAEDDLAALQSLAEHESEDVAYWAVTLIGRLESAAAPAVVKLAAILSGNVPLSVRERAAWALGKIGPSAKSASESLRQAASNGPERLHRLARQALEQVGR